jgi:hypothetical protein
MGLKKAILTGLLRRSEGGPKRYCIPKQDLNALKNNSRRAAKAGKTAMPVAVGRHASAPLDRW